MGETLQPRMIISHSSTKTQHALGSSTPTIRGLRVFVEVPRARAVPRKFPGPGRGAPVEVPRARAAVHTRLRVTPYSQGQGGAVYSETTDHTSTLKFLEQRFNIEIPNISPWRRAVVGDLTRAFDFENPDYSWPEFPDTSLYWDESKRQCDHNPPPSIPKVQKMPSQEVGVRVSRALGYGFEVGRLEIGCYGKVGTGYCRGFERSGHDCVPMKS